MTLAQTKRQHQYLDLPGEFLSWLPQEIVFPNLEVGRADEFYYADESLIVDLEEESSEITDDTMVKFSRYVIFASYMYESQVYLAVLCHKDPKKDFEYFKYAPSLCIKVHYIYFSQKELWAKYENIINKVQQKSKLTETEALDIAFVPKFIAKKHAPTIVESLANIFNNAIITDKLLKMDVGVILGGMIKKHFTNPEKQNKLMEKINMKHIEDEFTKFLYWEFGDLLCERDAKIEEKDREIESQKKEIESMGNKIKSKEDEIKSKDDEINKLNQHNKEYKNKLKILSEFKDLNAPEARSILNSLILLR